MNAALCLVTKATKWKYWTKSSYFAPFRVGRGKLVLRYSVLDFPPNFISITCWVAENNAVVCLGTRANIMVIRINITFPWVGIEPTTSSVYSHNSCISATAEPTNVAFKVTRLCHCTTTISLSNLSLSGIYFIWLVKFVVFKEKCLAMGYGI